MMRRNSIFTYEPDIYTPNGARKNLTPEQAKKEYQRLRSIALKRLYRFEGTEFTDTQMYKKNKNRFKPSSQLTRRELNSALTDVHRFLSSSTSTISGMRKAKEKALATLQRHGYTGVTHSNFKSFGEYMQRAKATHLGRYFDSERAAELFEEIAGENEMEEVLNPDEVLEAFHEFEKEEIRNRARVRRARRGK